MSAIRLLITGANGFVGRHMVKAARRIEHIDVRPTARTRVDDADGTCFVALDIEDLDATRSAIRVYRPTHILHLAGISSPVPGSSDARGIWHVNVTATIGLAHAVLSEAPDCWLMFASSGLVYGSTARSGKALDEAALLAPANAYAATKAAADLGLGAMVGGGLRTIRFRPFNHTGAGQSEDFVVPSFAAQIARIETGAAPPVIRVGDLSAERDFLDVGDVVDAYLAAIQRSDRLVSGAVLNIASGQPRRIESVLDQLLRLSRTQIRVETDPTRLRMGDIPHYVGDAGAAKAALGWSPQRAFETTLADVLADQRQRATC